MFRLAYKRDFTLLTAESGAAGLDVLRKTDVAVAVADQRMPEMPGVEFLRQSQELRPEAIRIILTGYADIEVLVDAVNSSRIYRYVTKPWDHQEMRITLKRAIEAYHLERENARLLEELKVANERLGAENVYLKQREERDAGIDGVVGASPAMLEVQRLLERVGPSPSTVLLLGETGTGKELLAHGIHAASRRAGRALVSVNIAAVPDTLLEAEFFGVSPGAYTGAERQGRDGKFKLADGGTLFLDEIGDMPMTMQAKLLRVLESGEVVRLGSNEARKADVRFVSATNRDLRALASEGKFREDLFFRINGSHLHIPALRERREDIPALVSHAVDRFAHEMAVKPQDVLVPGITDGAMMRLTAYAWPGNVRQLFNVVQNMVVACLSEPRPAGTPPMLDLRHIPDDVRSDHSDELPGPAGAASLAGTSLEQIEKRAIRETLRLTAGNREHAAMLLGIGERTLYRKLKEYGLR